VELEGDISVRVCEVPNTTSSERDEDQRRTGGAVDLLSRWGCGSDKGERRGDVYKSAQRRVL